MPHVYILESLRDKRYYIGSTTNLDARLKHHHKRLTPSTSRFGGVKLVFSQEYSTIREARTIERKLKKLKRRDYIDKIIEDGNIRMNP
ncbi:MAG: GIY-YIG nuclease family protein [Candidatus Moranbacteria bacterium]|nr:GIY-YIG nuclease family protein [Candidatus Moranbacteria bacterium]